MKQNFFSCFLLGWLLLLWYFQAWAAQTTPSFDPSWEKVPQTPVVSSVAEEEERLLSLLKDQRPDLGFYFVTTYDEDFENGENRYWYGLEWRLFDEGYYQAKREKAKKVLETRLELLQLKRDAFFRRLTLKRQHLHFVENLLLWRRSKDLKGLLEKIVRRREKALKAGFETRETFLRLKTRLEKLCQEEALLERLPREGLLPEERRLLNRLEKLSVKPLEALFSTAQARSFDLKILDLFVARAEFFPSWKDDVDLRLYLMARDEFYGTSRVVAGVKLALPLYLNRKRDEIVSLEKSRYESEKRIVRQKLKREIMLRRGRLEMALLKLRETLKDYALAEEELFLARQKLASPIQKLDKNPLNEVEIKGIALREAFYQVLAARIKAYFRVLELLSVIGEDDPTILFQE